MSNQDTFSQSASGLYSKLSIHCTFFHLHSVALKIKMHSGVELSPLLKTGIKVEGKAKAKYPVNFESKIDLETGKLKTKIELPQQVMLALSLGV